MRFLRALKYELLSILNHRGSKIVLFIGPWFLVLLFGGVYYNDYVKDIPIAVLDQDNSSASNTLVSYFNSNERFDTEYYPSSYDELESLIEEGKVSMGVFIPKGFGADVSSFKGSQVLAIVDGTNLVVANNAYANATSIVQSIGAGIEMKLIQGKGITPSVAQNMALTFNIQERILYDPKLTYMNALMLCFLAVFMQQLLLSAIGGTLIRDNQYISEDKTLLKVLAAGSACFLCILPSMGVSLAVLNKLYHIKYQGSIALAVMLMAAFTLSVIIPALFIASFTKNRLKYSQISFMLSLPTFVSSGCIWGVDQMPFMVKIIIKILWPLINFAKPFQEVLAKGLPIGAVMPFIFQLLLYTALWLPLSLYCYKKAYKGKGIVCND